MATGNTPQAAINDIKSSRDSIAQAIRNKGVTVDTTAKLADLPAKVAAIATANLQSNKTITPSESKQTVTPDSGYNGLSQVTVNAVSSTYVGSGVAKKSSSDLTASGATVTAPAGYYANAATKTISNVSGSIGGTATAGKATGVITNMDKMTVVTSPTGTAGVDYFRVAATATGTAGSYTPKYTVSKAGYIGSTVTGSAQSVSVTGDTTGQKLYIPKAKFEASGKSVKTTSSGGGYIPADTTVGSVAEATRASTTLTSAKSNNTLVFTASNPQTTGYVTADTSKNTATKTVSLSTSGATVTASDGTNSISSTIGAGSATTPATTITANPSLSTTYTSGSGYKMSVSKTQSVTPTVSAGYVSSGTAGTITVSGSAYVAQSSTGSATTSNTDTATRTIGYGQQTTIGAGYYPSARIIRNSVSAGKATTPTTSIAATVTPTIDSSGKITATASGSKSITPTVTAGYVSSGTAGTVSVSGSGTLQLTTKGATTITPSTSSQAAVASGVYTTGAITVSAVPTETKTVTSSTSAQTVTPTSGKFLSKVTVNAIPTETKTATPTTSAQSITPTSGKVLTKVTVNAIPNQKSASDVTVSGTTVTVPAGYYSSQVQKTVSGGSVPTTTIIIDTENVFSYGYGVDVYYTVYENGQVSNYHTYVDAFEFRQLSSIVIGSTITFVGDFWLDDYSLILKEDTTQNYQYSYVCDVPTSAYYMFWE